MGVVMKYQSYIYGRNHWLLEPDLGAILGQYLPDLPDHQETLIMLGELVGGAAYEVGYQIDRQSTPILLMHDVDGQRVDRALLSPAHTELLNRLVFINRPPYDGGSWHHHFALGFLLADPGLYCTLIVTNQTAYAIYKYAPEHKDWLERILNGEMWGATWMTETQSGSDLGANSTVAKQEKKSWRLYGDEKSFASNAGIADLALVTARIEGAREGPKGLSLFIVPRQTEEGQLNYIIRRYKAKSATRAVPTGEVELHGSEAYLVGEADMGIYYTLETLTVARLANAIGAMGLARKAHLEALFRVQTRQAFGKPLVDHPLVRRDLTDLAVRTAGGLCLIFHTIHLFDQAWHEVPPYSLPYHYARFLSHVAKNRTASHAADLTLLVMELFGGLGFLEEYPVARLHREALITPIWEGSSNIQALDMLEVMQKKGAHEPFLDEFMPLLDKVGTPEAYQARRTIEMALGSFKDLSPEQAQWYSKDALTRLADATQVALLYNLAESAGERYAKLAKLYAHRFLLDEPYPDWALEDSEIWFPLSIET
jgi:alkylation response protein AidB-like acyl-CoA dehydrogenase